VKTALITGAGGGIGSATVKKFISQGYFVIGQYNKNQQAVDSLRAQLDKEGKGDYFFAVQADFSNSSEISDMMDNVLKSFPRLDVVVNNAGKGLYKLITDTSEAEWDNLFSVNMKSAYLINNRALKAMIRCNQGKIINVSSMWGNVGASMEVAYSASKSAMIGYTKALAKEVAPSNITVNCVCPGVIDTPINARFTEQEMQELACETPLGRIGKAEEIAELIYFLASDSADFITGQIITCDGGFSL
jgi:3-oxoacyl-[acyl-carrier protein] reductase